MSEMTTRQAHVAVADRTDKRVWAAVIDARTHAPEGSSSFGVTSSATGAEVAQVVAGDLEVVDLAVRSSRRAYEEDWRWRPPRERAALVRQAGQLIRQHLPELVELEVTEVGKPRAIAEADVNACINAYDFYAGIYHHLHGEVAQHGVIRTQVTYEPYGVVAGILPFNWPPNHFGRKTGPALVAGNTVVIKPSEQAPLAALLMTELVNEVLPPGVVNAVPGVEAGPALVSHPLVERISFTGSSATGQAVLEAAAKHHAFTTTELGGKNALIVLDDADVDSAVDVAIEGMFYNSGAACSSTSRILVHQSKYEMFLERFSGAVTALVVGDGLDPRTEIGPMVDARHRDRVLGFLKTALEEGATIYAQGSIPDDPRLKGGFWVPPTVLVNADPDSTVGQQEVFGPVVVVMSFASDQEAVEIANGTAFGLNAAVCSGDEARAFALAERLEVGRVYVNNYFRAGSEGVPFGGVKASGFGRESSTHTLLDYVRAKAVFAPSGRGRVPTWPPRS